MNTATCAMWDHLNRAAEIEQLTVAVQCRLSGRVRDLEVVAKGEGLVLRGHSHTYYGKQLAQHAVMVAMKLPILANEIEVS